MQTVLDILLDIFIFLELNELEKCQIVCRQWAQIVFDLKDSPNIQKRRIYSLLLTKAPIKKIENGRKISINFYD